MTRTNEMSRWVRAAAFLALGLAAVVIPVGCGTSRSPVEQVGHEIDDVAEDVGESVDEATE